MPIDNFIFALPRRGPPNLLANGTGVSFPGEYDGGAEDKNAWSYLHSFIRVHTVVHN
jgi:hypothetical protein